MGPRVGVQRNALDRGSPSLLHGVWAPAHLNYFKQLLTTTNPARVAVRDSLTLAAAALNKASLVTKQATCVAAVNALNALRQEPGVVRQVWVYALGNNYAVEDPAIVIPPGVYRPIYLFSGNFAYKRTLAGI